jgi:DNA-binding NarL/FixJ family response regulator
MTIRVFLVDDHHIVRDGIARIVDSEPDLTVTGQAGSTAEGRALLTAGKADVLVVDVTMPDGSGLDLAKEARAAYPDMGILVLTMHEDDDTLLGALEAGASGFVVKTSPADAVLRAIRHAAAAPDAFTATGLVGALSRHAAAADSRPVLTPREIDVLLALIDGDSVSSVAHRLYMSESTVKTHVVKMYKKLGVHNRTGAISAAFRLGLVKFDDNGSRAPTEPGD